MPQIVSQSRAARDETAVRIRATQGLVGHMAFSWGHPSLTAIEVVWRWLFGVPFLWLAWGEARKIVAAIPLASVGLDRMSFQNPWLSSVIAANAFARYQPAVIAVLHWLLPLGIAGWAVVSGLGRMLVLMRLLKASGLSGDPNETRRAGFYLRRLPALIVLQALWMTVLCACFCAWYGAVGWASARYITTGAEPELIGYLCWLIFFSLGIYTLWALVSWTLAVAPVVLMMDRDGGLLRTLGASFSLGRTLSNKLMEISLVMAIVKIMLIVLDMVLSAAPLPFADEFGPDALHWLYVAVAVAFLLANDYFYVVRLRSFATLVDYFRKT